MVTPGDGRRRCAWALTAPDYVVYHDDEWGTPVRGDQVLFERLTLEAFQSGLSWLTILRKRPAFRVAFAGFDPASVARFDERDVERLMADASIVRNRRKIDAAITNARALVEWQRREGAYALSTLMWSYHGDVRRARPESLEAIPGSTSASTALSRELKDRGFVFIGPTTVYAAMQACGIVDDHVVDCWRATTKA